jgi:hypothetical protein
VWWEAENDNIVIMLQGDDETKKASKGVLLPNMLEISVTSVTKVQEAKI